VNIIDYQPPSVDSTALTNLDVFMVTELRRDAINSPTNGLNAPMGGRSLPPPAWSA
jgi:hypothetical protein